MGGACASRNKPVHKLDEAPKNAPAELSPYTSGPYFVCDPDGEFAPRFARGGVASEEKTPARTMIDMLTLAAEKHGDKPIFKVERPVPGLLEGGKKAPPALPEEEWTQWTYGEFLQDVKATAKAFIKLGHSPHDAVNIWGFNTPEWVVAAHAAAWAGGKCGGLYPTDTIETAAFKVVHSGGSIIVVEDAGKLKKLQEGLKARGDCKRVKAVIAYDFEPTEKTVALAGCGDVPLLSWKDMIAMGKGVSDEVLQERTAKVKPGNCCALIYTSGTTGDPKAVMISHDNIIFEASSFMKALGDSVGFGRGAEQERVLSYLPLSHVVGMMVDITTSVVMGATTESHVTVYFARNYDLKVGAIKDRLCVAKPTFFVGVPLVWEKIADKIRAIGAANTGLKKSMGDWAKGVALENSRSKQLGQPLVEPLGITPALLLLGKVKESLGLDQCKVGFSGAAPIRKDTLEYFGSLGINILEGYGMSECGGACTASTIEAHQWGSCGYELPGVEVKAFRVDETDFNKKRECPRAPGLESSTDEQYQGELCFRGRNNMMGYMCQPDLGQAHCEAIRKKTAEAIDDEGWLHSGDKGMITQAGFVKITGRYKELIIGEGGENVAPVPIEDNVKKLCDGICEIMMVGDKRKYNVAIVTLKAVGANGEMAGTDELDAGAKRVNPEVTTISGAMKDKTWIDTITKAITETNNNGVVCFNNSTKIQKFTILPSNFSEEGGELTPTKKLKRPAVQTKFNNCIEKMYKESGVYIEFAP